MDLVSKVGLLGLVWSFGSSRSGGSCGFCGSCGSSGFGGSCESDWLGGSGSLVGIFFLFDLIQKYFQMELLSFMTHKNLMIPKPLVV